MKVVSLSVHRNTAQRRRERQVSRDLISDAKKIAGRKDVSGYAIVAWDSNTDADVSWSYTKEINCSILPEFVKTSIIRKLAMIDKE